MLKVILLSCFTIVFGRCLAQADFVVIKKKGRTVQSFYGGSVVLFKTTTGEWINARIESVKKDSLFFREMYVRQVPTYWGTTRPDTIATPLLKIHYRDIAAIPKKKGFRNLSVANLMMIGGSGYLFLNLVNSAYLKYPPFGEQNLPNILSAAAVAAAGFTISSLQPKEITVGKKYTLHYVALSQR